MEYRTDSRTYAAINLLIYKSGVPVAIGTTRDISTTGMFVQTNYVGVDPGQVLEFELLYSRKIPSARTRYRAVINEQRNEGLVLKFDTTGNHDARKLAAMVEWVAHAHGANSHEANNHEESGHEENSSRKKLNRLVLIPNVAGSVR